MRTCNPIICVCTEKPLPPWRCSQVYPPLLILVCAGGLGQVQPTFGVLHVFVLAASAGLEAGTFSHVTPQHTLSFSLVWEFLYNYSSLHTHKRLTDHIHRNLHRKVFSDTAYSLRMEKLRKSMKHHYP